MNCYGAFPKTLLGAYLMLLLMQLTVAACVKHPHPTCKKPVAKPELKPGEKSDGKHEAQTEVNPKESNETKSEEKSKKLKPESNSDDTKSEEKSKKLKSESNSDDTKSEVKSDAAKSESKSDETKSEGESVEETEEKSEEKTETKVETNPELKPESTPQLKAQKNPCVKPEPNLAAQPSDDELGFNGNLYDVFKKHLNEVFRELYNNVSLPFETKLPEKPDLQKRAAVSNCLYEEFKRRLDKFNNEFVMQPGKSFKRMSIEGDGGCGEKRSTVQECLYEEYKKRLDKIGNELSFDGEKVFDRSGRGVPDVYELLIAKRSRPARSFDQATNRNFYEEYKNKLNELTRELYEKSNERIHRAYAQLDSDDLGSPTLQRWVSLVQPNQNDKTPTADIKGNAKALQRNCRSDLADKQHKPGTKDVHVDTRAAADNKRSLGIDEIGTSIFGSDALTYGNGVSASYPSVLTKALESNMGMLGNTAPKNLLAAVAQKMNMTTLDLAKKLAAMSSPSGLIIPNKKDSQLTEELQKFADLTVNKLTSIPEAMSPAAGKKQSSREATTSSPPAQSTSGTPTAAVAATAPPSAASVSSSSSAASLAPTAPPQPPASTKCATTTDSESSRIAYVLEKVLSKLERIQMGKESSESSENCEPDGVPCDISGSWNSYTMGLRFDISLGKAADRRLGPAEKNNKLLTIEVAERIPPRPHHIIGTNWKFMGSALNQHGGPFYIYSQNREESIVATFIGYCRSCGAIDTIFGSWTIMGPSKDCEDVTTSLETKRDIFRRYNMESKRKQRLKDMLFDKSKYSKAECEDKD